MKYGPSCQTISAKTEDGVAIHRVIFPDAELATTIRKASSKQAVYEIRAPMGGPVIVLEYRYDPLAIAFTGARGDWKVTELERREMKPTTYDKVIDEYRMKLAAEVRREK